MSTNRQGYLKAYYQAHKEQYKVYAKRAADKRKALKKIEEVKVEPICEQVWRSPDYSRQYYLANRETILAKQKAYREAKRKRDIQRAYYEEHRDQYRMYAQRAYQRKKRKEKLSKSFFGRLWLKVKPN